MPVPAAAPPRGHACAICRKRKLKCDADKPRCKQCVRANRGNECYYDENRTTNTQKLQEQIRQLEERLRMYKTLSADQTVVAGSDAHVPQSPTPSSLTVPTTTFSCVDGTHPQSHLAPSHQSGSSNTSDPSSNETHGLFGGNRNSTGGLSTFTTVSSGPGSSIPGIAELSGQVRGMMFPPSGSSGSWLTATQASRSLMAESPPSVHEQEWDTEALPAGIDQRTMLTVFTGHRHQAHFEFNIDRFLRSLSLPRDSPDRPHPCLMNAIYLFASHFSRSSHLSMHDAIFLARARTGITVALQKKDRILHAIQAACIVSFYLFFKGKVLEGYWMSGATCRMAIACGLHQIKATLSSDSDAPSSARIMETGNKMVVLPELKNNVELGERVHTFWQVWCVDKYGVLSTGFAPSLVDVPDIPLLKIKTCWPPAMRTFIKDAVTPQDIRSFQSLYDDSPSIQPPGKPESISSIQYKVMELWVRATNLRRQGPSQPDFPKHFREIEVALTRVERMIPPLAYFEEGDSPPTDTMPIHPRMILPHAMIHATKINLHTTLSSRDSRSYDLALTAANGILGILEGIMHYEFNYLEVVLAVCFKHASETFMNHVDQLQRRNDPEYYQTIQTYQSRVNTTTLAMKKICHLYAATVVAGWSSM